MMKKFIRLFKREPKPTTKADVLLVASRHFKKEKRKPHTIRVWDGSNGYRENTFI